ncbi:MAG: prephenate dehydrogenase/arogenate dehydrogenase family protein [Desulfobacteraceae bacterium]|nr:MAG: prephenate dehydrogenase/arogenate dehydrogenase family protein [Desulfobacteraceae bacterium]
MSRTKDIRIHIIGGTGGMGKWFADFLRSKGYLVRVSGKDEEESIPALAASADVVVVAVPIHVTLETIAKVGPHMRHDGLLMDLTSLKAEPVRKMVECSRSEIIGLHPLFGPAVNRPKGENVVLCPAGGRSWLPWVRDLFSEEGVNLVETSPEKHDEMMAYVQALTHLATVAMGLSLRNSGIEQEELLKFSTPAFRSRMAAVEKVFGENPRLYGDIMALNPHSTSIGERFQSSVSRLMDFIGRKDSEGITRMMEKSVTL